MTFNSHFLNLKGSISKIFKLGLISHSVARETRLSPWQTLGLSDNLDLDLGMVGRLYPLDPQNNWKLKD